MNTGDGIATPPSQGFQDQLLKTQADGSDVISDPVDTEKGLQQLQGFVVNDKETVDEDVMEWDKIKATCRAEGFDMDAADDLPELTEEEVAATNLLLEENADTNIQEAEELETLGGDEAKKQATKKILFKSTSSTAASNKMRVANALASPRKRVPAKTSNRHGESRNQPEGKVRQT